MKWYFGRAWDSGMGYDCLLVLPWLETWTLGRKEEERPSKMIREAPRCWKGTMKDIWGFQRRDRICLPTLSLCYSENLLRFTLYVLLFVCLVFFHKIGKYRIMTKEFCKNIDSFTHLIVILCQFFFFIKKCYNVKKYINNMNKIELKLIK